jgi:hypothetical protein
MYNDDRPSLLTIIVDILFGFAIGLVYFWGVKEALHYGTALANKYIAMALPPQAAALSIGSYVPYVVFAPLAGFALRDVASVRSIKHFIVFIGCLAIGFAAAFFVQGQVHAWFAANVK